PDSSFLVLCPRGSCANAARATSMTKAAFLVLEDDAPLSRALSRVVRSVAPCIVSNTVEEAIGLVHSPQPGIALLVDRRLAHGAGFDFLPQARVLSPAVPALVVTGLDDAWPVNRAFDLGARILRKPTSRERILAFLRESQIQSNRAEDRRLATTWAWAHRY